jgi:hypothetical protein
MIYPRYGLQESDYGFITVYYTPSPARATIAPSTPVAPASAAEATGLAAAVIAKVTSLVEHYAEVFPALVADFDQNWDWEKTWDDPDKEKIQSSDGFAQGVEWDALVAMGTAILPQVVAKLGSDANIFGCDLLGILYIVTSTSFNFALNGRRNKVIETDNSLQTDPTKKVDPGDLENYWVLNNQAKAIVKLYEGQAADFESLATDWATAQRIYSRSSDSYSFTSGPAYDAMGKPAVPFIMDMYAREQDGWWHEP